MEVTLALLVVSHRSPRDSDSALAAQFLLLCTEALRLLRVESILTLRERWLALGLEHSAPEVVTHVGETDSESIVAKGALSLRGKRLALWELLIFAGFAKAAKTSESEGFLLLIRLFDTGILDIA